MALVAPSAAAWSHPGDGPGVLVLHGFTGNPTSLRPLAARLAAEGYSVELPRLPGHGTNYRELATTTWSQWLAEVVAAFDRLEGRPRAIVGLSMGATLALRLAQLRPTDVAALVLINPSVTFEHPFKPALGLLKRVIPWMPGVGNDIAKPGADELPYSRVPLTAAASLFELQDIVRAHLHAVDMPTLVLTSRNDHTVRPTDSAVILDRIASPRREQVWLERSFHVATLDHDADMIGDRTIEWLAATVGSPDDGDAAGR
ncbi:MAG: alpha/beta fold hydrolase [Actinobacteria bacterium]|nr:alpha/beta fold hydrolase [Actinomycetota bacterium]